MTIIFLMANQDQIIQVSDRRLSNRNTVLENESNKSTVIFSDSARVVVGYTGLAYSGKFRTQRWMLETFTNCGPPDYSIEQTIHRFADIATNTFWNHPLLATTPKELKGLTITFSGFGYGPDQPAVSQIMMVSNCVDKHNHMRPKEPQSEFEVFSSVTNLLDKDFQGVIHPIGNVSAIIKNELDDIKHMLRQRRPWDAIARKAVFSIRHLADRPKSGVTIGKDLMVVVMPRDATKTPTALLARTNGSNTLVMPDYIKLSPNDGMIISGFEFISHDQQPLSPVVAPTLSRNSPCYCGSNKAYKRCHGKKRWAL